MINIKYIYFIPILIAIMGCEKDKATINSIQNTECTDNVVLNNLFLKEESKNVIPYKINDTVYFKNNKNEEIKYTLISFKDSFMLDWNQKIPCNSKNDSISVIYRMERKFIKFESDSNIELKLNQAIHFEQDESYELKFYDALGIISKDIVYPYKLLTSNRSELNYKFTFENSYENNDSIEILGKVYYDVYIFKNELAYNKNKGILFFTDRNDEKWYLDRIE